MHKHVFIRMKTLHQQHKTSYTASCSSKTIWPLQWAVKANEKKLHQNATDKHDHVIKNTFFWVITPCSSKKSLSSGGIYHFHLRDRRFVRNVGRAVAQAVSRLLPPRRAGFASGQSMSGVWWTKRHWGRFSPSTSFPLPIIIPPISPPL
jgi:hypothetical protein